MPCGRQTSYSTGVAEAAAVHRLKENMNVREEKIFYCGKRKGFLHPVNLWTNSNSARSPVESSGGARLGSFKWDQLDLKTWIIRVSRVFRLVHKGVSFEGHICHGLTLCRLLEET